jgi:hypothetical protein
LVLWASGGRWGGATVRDAEPERGVYAEERLDLADFELQFGLLSEVQVEPGV